VNRSTAHVLKARPELILVEPVALIPADLGIPEDQPPPRGNDTPILRAIGSFQTCTRYPQRNML
jgi:hypothetical protein